MLRANRRSVGCVVPKLGLQAPSCLSILEADPSASSGLYWITKLAAEVGTNGDRGMQVYCLM